MLDALLTYAAAGQPAIVTPFLLMGAMSPVSIPAALVQQTAEALAGVALTQLVRPGTPVVLGSFLSHTDMQSGSPGFGGPESAIGLFCTGQIARRLGLPWRSGGGALTSSQLPGRAGRLRGAQHDAAGLPRRRELRHAHGGLARVRASSPATRSSSSTSRSCARCARSSRRSRWTRRRLAYGAHQEVGHGGHFLGAEHTLERFRDCFYRPLLSSTENYQRWMRNGGSDSAERARRSGARRSSATSSRRWTPPCRAELEEFVRRRRAELGD